jgi:hypothetical protein
VVNIVDLEAYCFPSSTRRKLLGFTGTDVE